MTIVSYYVAQSLDGYIADLSHGVSWLDSIAPNEVVQSFRQPGDTENLFKYEDYLKSVGAIVMGRKTYDFLVQYGSNPYQGIETWVLSESLSAKAPLLPGIQLAPPSMDLKTFVSDLMNRTNKRIWIVGGGDVAAQVLELDLLDEIIVSIAPRTLQAGIPLFRSLNMTSVKNWKLTQTQITENGFVQLCYRK
jgi:dihydrofolate reductase